MNTPAETAPPAREFTAAWVAYALHAVGLAIPFFFWPAIGGLIVNYIKRGDPLSGFIDSHHRWMIRTFWWGLAGYAAGLLVIAFSAMPALRAALRAEGGHVDLRWNELLSILAAASFGAAVLLAVWLWLIYRVIRGALRLNDAQPAP